MSWLYRSSSIEYRRRSAICVDTVNRAGSSGDIQITIPTDWDEFWQTFSDLSDTNGYSLRVTLGDGKTVATYAFSGAFNLTTRTCVIQIESPTLATSGDFGILFLYWDPTSIDDNGAGSVTYSADYTGVIRLSGPSGCHVYRAEPHQINSTQPATRISKTQDEDLWVWLDVTDCLMLRAGGDQYVSRSDYEEIFDFEVDVTDGGASQAGMLSTDWGACCYTADGRKWIRAFIQGGSDGTDYTIEIRWRGYAGESDTGGTGITNQYEWRAFLRVEEYDET